MISEAKTNLLMLVKMCGCDKPLTEKDKSKVLALALLLRRWNSTDSISSCPATRSQHEEAA
jgi:hypothetical protein